MNMSLSALEDSITSQLHTFQKEADKLQLPIHHIKPHGALYNQAVLDPDTAKVILKIMKVHFPEVILYAPYGSVIANLAQEWHIKVWYEAFADRNYADDLTLISRSHEHAIKHEIDDILKNIDLMTAKQQVKTLTGKIFDLKVDTICIHGDNPMAEIIAKTVYTHLQTKI